GRSNSLLVPLLLLSVTLAGHGIRERLAHYLLSASWLVNLSAVGAYFLALRTGQIDMRQPWALVNALLIAAGVAWLCSILWTRLASWLEQDEEKPLLDSVLLNLNSCLGVLCYGIVLARAIVS